MSAVKQKFDSWIKTLSNDEQYDVLKTLENKLKNKSPLWTEDEVLSIHQQRWIFEFEQRKLPVRQFPVSDGLGFARTPKRSEVIDVQTHLNDLGISDYLEYIRMQK